LIKKNDFNFDSVCIYSFSLIKTNLVNALVMIAPNWDIHFEMMCDASDYTHGAILRQCKEIVSLNLSRKKGFE